MSRSRRYSTHQRAAESTCEIETEQEEAEATEKRCYCLWPVSAESNRSNASTAKSRQLQPRGEAKQASRPRSSAKRPRSLLERLLYLGVCCCCPYLLPLLWWWSCCVKDRLRGRNDAPNSGTSSRKGKGNSNSKHDRSGNAKSRWCCIVSLLCKPFTCTYSLLKWLFCCCCCCCCISCRRGGAKDKRHDDDDDNDDGGYDLASKGNKGAGGEGHGGEHDFHQLHGHRCHSRHSRHRRHNDHASGYSNDDCSHGSSGTDPEWRGSSSGSSSGGAADGAQLAGDKKRGWLSNLPGAGLFDGRWGGGKDEAKHADTEDIEQARSGPVERLGINASKGKNKGRGKGKGRNWEMRSHRSARKAFYKQPSSSSSSSPSSSSSSRSDSESAFSAESMSGTRNTPVASIPPPSATLGVTTALNVPPRRSRSMRHFQAQPHALPPTRTNPAHTAQAQAQAHIHAQTQSHPTQLTQPSQPVTPNITIITYTDGNKSSKKGTGRSRTRSLSHSHSHSTRLAHHSRPGGDSTGRGTGGDIQNVTPSRSVVIKGLNSANTTGTATVSMVDHHGGQYYDERGNCARWSGSAARKGKKRTPPRSHTAGHHIPFPVHVQSSTTVAAAPAAAGQDHHFPSRPMLASASHPIAATPPVLHKHAPTPAGMTSSSSPAAASARLNHLMSRSQLPQNMHLLAPAVMGSGSGGGGGGGESNGADSSSSSLRLQQQWRALHQQKKDAARQHALKVSELHHSQRPTGSGGNDVQMQQQHQHQQESGYSGPKGQQDLVLGQQEQRVPSEVGDGTIWTAHRHKSGRVYYHNAR